MAQIISIIDAYGYLPMVRQVFSQRVFGPRIGRVADEAQLRAGIEGSSRVLSALESIVAVDGPVAGGGGSLADFSSCSRDRLIWRQRPRENRRSQNAQSWLHGGESFASEPVSGKPIRVSRTEDGRFSRE